MERCDLTDCWRDMIGLIDGELIGKFERFILISVQIKATNSINGYVY